jgi:hypothetical protein
LELCRKMTDVQGVWAQDGASECLFLRGDPISGRDES